MPVGLPQLLQRLEPWHQSALGWFASRRGEVVGWPGKLDDGTLLVSKGKAIYKPKQSDYALSVRQNLGSPYADREPVVHPDGTWTYEYAPEEGSDDLFTNAGLLACKADQVPVAVIRELPETPGTYRVHGLALVVRRTPEYFILEGFGPAGLLDVPGLAAESEEQLSRASDAADEAGDFDPASAEQARNKVIALIARRRGAKRFRNQLIKAYAGRCAITGCADLDVLEAAHIMPYRGDSTNHVQNGLLLRADVHTLFDVGLLGIEPERLLVRVSPTLQSAGYRELDGKALKVPEAAKDRPNRRALQAKWAERDWQAPASREP
jgi:hypothetical protein